MVGRGWSWQSIVRQPRGERSRIDVEHSLGPQTPERDARATVRQSCWALDVNGLAKAMDKTLLFPLLVLWLLSVAAVHGYAHRQRLPHPFVVLSHLVPSLVALVMIRVFIVGHGALVAQFAAGSEHREELWSFWLSIWPLALVALAASALANLVAFITGIVVQCHQREARWLPVPAIGLIISLLWLAITFSHFPTA